ncbi:hypothetical protein SynMITS9220_00093 [Synechococcus sp. MIT S9220]|nr:hypothetical protein SynMITS9220_00093 [Synechococcus sp. MIT S9220]
MELLDEFCAPLGCSAHCDAIEAAVVLTIFVEATPSQNRQFSCDELQMLY